MITFAWLSSATWRSGGTRIVASKFAVEMMESTYPVMVEEYGYVPDSEGAGRHCGGLGVRRRIRVLAPGPHECIRLVTGP